MVGAVVSKLRLPRALSRGFDPGAVDARLTEVAGALDAGRPPSHAQLACDFPTARRGYLRSDVGWLLGQLADPAGEPSPWLAQALLVSVALLVVAAVIAATAGAGAASVALVVLVVGVTPLRGRVRYQSFALRTWFVRGARDRYYVSSSVPKWALVGVVVIIGAFAGRTWRAIYLGAHLTGVGAFLTVEVLLISVMVVVVLRMRLRRARTQPWSQLVRLVEMAGAILPRTRTERHRFVLVAVTAGITEEILFRGFGIAFVRWLNPSASDLLVIVATAVAFGLVHLYQGPRGVALTGLVGALLAWITVLSGSLLPAILLHVAADLRMLLIPADAIDEAVATTLGVSWAYTTRWRDPGLDVPADRREAVEGA